MSENPTNTVLFLMRLTSLELREEYETWVREVDTPGAIALPGILSYRVFRLDAPLNDGDEPIGYDYLEVIDVSDLDLYRSSLSSLPASFFDTLRTFIGHADGVVASQVN